MWSPELAPAGRSFFTNRGPAGVVIAPVVGETHLLIGVGLAASITAGTQMKIEFLDTYKSRPPLPGIQRNDIATLVSFVYKFD